MLKRLLSFFTRRPVRDLDAMLARRGTRLHNRSREGAARYERTHAILARERRRGFLARWWGRA